MGRGPALAIPELRLRDRGGPGPQLRAAPDRRDAEARGQADEAGSGGARLRALEAPRQALPRAVRGLDHPVRSPTRRPNGGGSPPYGSPIEGPSKGLPKRWEAPSKP